jgi:NADH dehydrogenase [ubiquinone] 1 alpha subcomplex assembly factor 7
VSADDPSPLALKLAQRITEQGPIGIADYMAAALTDPEHGYYMGRDPLGAAGDFITAPEVSQMFGELIGLWCAETWARLGAPAPVALVELGPGRGTLMADALRAARQVPAFADVLRVHLVEVSPSLRARQEETLADVKPSWHESLAGVPDLPVLLIANEFRAAGGPGHGSRGPRLLRLAGRPGRGVSRTGGPARRAAGKPLRGLAGRPGGRP